MAWKTVATDLFVFQDKAYILIIDLFSHFPVVRQLHGESTKLVLDALKDVFSDLAYIKLNTKSCNGNSMKTHFKVDKGADGNLLPLGEFFKHFPDANMTQLAKIIDPHTMCIHLSIPKWESSCSKLSSSGQNFVGMIM